MSIYTRNILGFHGGRFTRLRLVWGHLNSNYTHLATQTFHGVMCVVHVTLSAQTQTSWSGSGAYCSTSVGLSGHSPRVLGSFSPFGTREWRMSDQSVSLCVGNMAAHSTTIVVSWRMSSSYEFPSSEFILFPIVFDKDLMWPSQTPNLITSHSKGRGLESAAGLQLSFLLHLLAVGTCLGRFVAAISSRRFGLEARPVHLKFVVDKPALGKAFLRLLQFSPISINPPTFRIHSFIHLSIIHATSIYSHLSFKNSSVRLCVSLRFSNIWTTFSSSLRRHLPFSASFLIHLTI
jgi:hypothetical protein